MRASLQPQILKFKKHFTQYERYRSTLLEKQGQWELVEMAKPINSMADQEEAMEELRDEGNSKVMSFVASEGYTPEAFQFVLNEEYEAPKPNPEHMKDLVQRFLEVMKLKGWILMIRECSWKLALPYQSS